VGESVRDPRGDFDGNIAVTFEILESVRSAGCRLVYPSTASVFDSMNALPCARQLMLGRLRPMRPARQQARPIVLPIIVRTTSMSRVARMFSVYGVGMNRFFIHDLIRNIQRGFSTC